MQPFVQCFHRDRLDDGVGWLLSLCVRVSPHGSAWSVSSRVSSRASRDNRTLFHLKQGAKDQQRVQDRMEHLEAGKEECASDCSGDLAGHGVGAVLHRLVSCADRDDISRVPATCVREPSAASARGINT